jgi:hypothetical protein
VQVTIKIDQAQDVQINILAGQTFSVVNIGPPSVGAGPWSYTQANVGYFKRLVAGPMTDIHEDTDTITIGQKQLLADLDLYVANGNPDISPHFSTIQKALNYLGQYVIPTSIRARVNVSPGTYTSSTATVIDHPNSQSITIQGPQNTTYTGTSLSITGSAYNWDMTIYGISDTSQFAVNYYAIIHYVGGVTNVSHALACGCHKVLAKTASSVTLRVMNPKTSFSVVGASSIVITPISVILTSDVVNIGPVYIGSYGVGLFQYMAIIASLAPTLATSAIFMAGASHLKFVGVSLWNVLLNDLGNNTCQSINAVANVACEFCAATYNQSGFVASANGSYVLRGCVSNYHSFRGIWIESGAVTFVLDPTFVGGCTREGIALANNGYGAVQGGQPMGFVLCHQNDDVGLICYGGGGLAFSSSQCNMWLQGNGLASPTHYDVVVQNYGLVNSSACITGTRIFNSPVGVINSTGGLIN